MQSKSQLRQKADLFQAPEAKEPKLLCVFSKQWKIWNTHVSQQQNILEKAIYSPAWNEHAACSLKVCSRCMKENEIWQ